MWLSCFNFLFTSKNTSSKKTCNCKKKNYLKNDLPEFFPPFPHSFN